MNRHPGGAMHTRHMLELAALPDGARILDMGAGAGEAVAMMQELGYQADGIDLDPQGNNVRQADLLSTGLPAECYDAVLSQCSFYISGNVPGALKETHRILKTGGTLMLSDVEFTPLRKLAEEAGFQILYDEDLTMVWREYYIEALWRGEDCKCKYPRGTCGYRLLIATKE